MSARAPMVMTQACRAAVLEAEARRLAHVLQAFGVLTRRQLAELSGSRLWARGRFAAALELAEERGLIRHLGCDFYAVVVNQQGKPAARAELTPGRIEPARDARLM